VCKELIPPNFDPTLKVTLSMVRKAEQRNKAVVYVKPARTGIRPLKLVHKERMKDTHLVNRNA